MSVLQAFTMRNLKLNRWRTFITVIGIMLSVAMMTAVAGFVTSFVDTFRYVERQSGGEWLAAIFDAPAEAQAESWMTDSFRTRYIGSIAHPHPANERMDKLHLVQYDAGAFLGFHVQLLQGRMALGPSEAVVESRSGLALDEKVVTYRYNDAGEAEEVSFTVVGTFSGRSYSYYGAFEIILGFDSETSAPCELYFSTDPIDTAVRQRAEAVAEKWPGAYAVDNHSLLRLYDPFGELKVLYVFGSILLLIIIIGSVMVIYNAFAISVADRTKQIGILRSVGATKRQVRSSVIFEGLFLAVIAIPLGILLGLVVEYIAIYLANGLLEDMIWGGTALRFTFSWQGIGLSALLSILTIMISAWYPARRMAGMSAIEAIRQQQDINLKSNQVRTPRWLNRALGFEAVLALKSMGRYRSKYRATILSLITSIVLFLAVSSFAIYMQESTEVTFTEIDYNIAVSLRSEDISLKDGLLALSGINSYSTREALLLSLEVPEDKLSERMRDFSLQTHLVSLNRLDEQSFASYCQQLNITPGANSVILVNTTGTFARDNKRMRFPMFTYKIGETVTVPTEEQDLQFKITAISEETPSDTDLNPHQDRMTLVVAPDYPLVLSEGWLEIYLQVDDAAEYYAQALLLAEPSGTFQVQDLGEVARQTRNINLFVQLFVYGFVAMLSLVGVTSVIGAVSTSITLRRQEFAMLQSIGMTPRGFHKMLRVESLLYGIQSLLLGVPLGLGVGYWLYTAMLSDFEYPYRAPWPQVALCAATIFLVVFLTMTYAGRKATRDNIVDTLRQESI